MCRAVVHVLPYAIASRRSGHCELGAGSVLKITADLHGIPCPTACKEAAERACSAKVQNTSHYSRHRLQHRATESALLQAVTTITRQRAGAPVALPRQSRRQSLLLRMQSPSRQCASARISCIIVWSTTTEAEIRCILAVSRICLREEIRCRGLCQRRRRLPTSKLVPTICERGGGCKTGRGHVVCESVRIWVRREVCLRGCARRARWRFRSTAFDKEARGRSSSAV